MNKKYILLLFSFFMIFSTLEAQKVVRVGAFNYYPGIFQDADGEIKGFYVDALTELGHKENIRFEYVYGTWDEGLERIKSGEVDVLTSVALTEERKKFMDYTNTPLLTVWSEVYVYPDSEINGILDLEGKTIAVMKSDHNGRQFRSLTEKLSVNCTFIETGDFDDVFSLIAGKKVDAGVVNNTFGAPRAEQYGLLSSGIVFNPFDIFFTVRKNSNTELLKLLEKYLNDWKHDRNSVLNVSRLKWTHGKVGSIEVFPSWTEEAVYTVFVIIIGLIVFIVLLRFRVRVVSRKVKYSEQLFATFMQNTPAYVYIKDEKLNHIYRNRMVDKVNKMPPDGKFSSAKTVFEPHIAELVEKSDVDILSQKIQQTNLEYKCKLNDVETWLNDYKFFLKLPNGSPAIGGISFDITRLKEIEEELIKAKDKAEESDRLKTAFLANMSHEIRTPMNGILGFAELLKEPNLKDEKQQQYVDIIVRNGARMLNIINDIIDISKIESGLMKVKKTDSNINHMLDELFHFFRQEANRKSITLNLIKGLDDSEAGVRTDGDKLYAVLTNLLKNAIKYTNSGSIEFGYEGNDAQNLLIFYVKDTGIGVSEEKQAVIFERFIQADIEDKMALQGAGLGLAISKAYVEMLGGKIWVESETAKGSTFYFTVPYVKSKAKKSVQDAQQTAIKKTDPPKFSKLLIAEDDDASLQFLTIVFQPYAGEILHVRNGIHAVDAVRNNPDIDLILMDLQMPKLNGFEATRQIREMREDIVIIAQTAFAQVGDREKAINAGCNEYIAKPIKKAEMLQLIQKFNF